MPSLRLITAATLAIGLVACGKGVPERNDAGRDEVRVLVTPLVIDRSRARIEAVGTSRAIRSIDLHPAASGKVDAVYFEAGQQVGADDVLVELDSREEQLAVRLARVRVEDAERLFDRYQRSGDSGAILPTQVDAARTALESTRIELQRAQVALDDRSIQAPFSGHVDLTEVDPGDRINPDTLITTLDDRSELLVSFEVPELMIGELQIGDEVTLATWKSSGPTFTGRIVEIGSRIDADTRTFVARATVDNSADRLRPGMSFRVSLEIEGTRYPVVTETALQWGADGAYVWTVEDGLARRIPVRIVQRQQGRVLFEAGIEPGSLIVVEGMQRMRDGIAAQYDIDSGHGAAAPGKAE